ncbi:MAG TPA: hypothetical protein PL064_06760, partial [Thermogutta sp.]|nr:hypothetical protein [Thermogutta sp.]
TKAFPLRPSSWRVQIDKRFDLAWLMALLASCWTCDRFGSENWTPSAARCHSVVFLPLMVIIGLG